MKDSVPQNKPSLYKSVSFQAFVGGSHSEGKFGVGFIYVVTEHMFERYTIWWRGIQYSGEVYRMLERYTVYWRGIQYVGEVFNMVDRYSVQYVREVYEVVGTVTKESNDYFATHSWALKKSHNYIATGYWAPEKVTNIWLFVTGP